MAAIGVDACRAGWFAVRLASEAEPEARIFPNIETLWDAWGSTCDLALIDVPIGLETSSACRACDAEARRLLGSPRASSVFNPPVRDVLRASDWEEAAALNAAATGKRISQQAWGIVPNIREVDEFVRRDVGRQGIVREVHPELLFWALNGGRPLGHAKKRSQGIEERLGILDRHHSGASGIAGQAIAAFARRVAQRDDVVDALAAAVTASRYRDRLRTLPRSPQHDRHGLRMEMVVPATFEVADPSALRSAASPGSTSADPEPPTVNELAARLRDLEARVARLEGR